MVDNDNISFSEWQAGTRCADHATVATVMQHIGYQETATNQLSTKIISHLYVSKEGEWLFTFQNTVGVECLIAQGTDWYNTEAKGANK